MKYHRPLIFRKSLNEQQDAFQQDYLETTAMYLEKATKQLGLYITDTNNTDAESQKIFAQLNALKDQLRAKVSAT